MAHNGNVYRIDGYVIVKETALARLVDERVDPRLWAAARMVMREWHELERQMGVTDDSVCAYVRLRYERGLRIGEIAARLGVSPYVLDKSVGQAVRRRMYRALRLLDAAYAERWWRRQGGHRRRARPHELVSLAV